MINIKNTAVAALVFVFVYNILFFQSGWGIGIGIFFLFLNIYFFFTKEQTSRNLNLALFSSVLSILFAFLFSFRGNEIVKFIDLSVAIFFSLTALYLYKYSEDLRFQIPPFLLIPLLVTERSIKGLLDILKTKNTSSALIRGLLITFPLVGILLLLLTLADPIFGKLTQNIFESIGKRTIISSVLFTILMGFGLSKFIKKISDKQEIAIPEDKSHELSIISGSIITLFAVFIIIQLRYLFTSVGERELHQLGINSLTYSEYVRKGFFELLIAASLASGVIIYIFRYLHYLKGNQKLLLQFFSALLTLETGLILLSAIKRLTLYADAHGLTRARVFGFIFLVWLALLLFIFLIKVFKEFKEKEFFA
ncbi:DUF4173 domain-containing protein [Candidatus Daviesbacteria bacterium]|nr:DUF4173 domain-containing protein [Candidatus Daviesbacteria bacterium]